MVSHIKIQNAYKDWAVDSATPFAYTASYNARDEIAYW